MTIFDFIYLYFTSFLLFYDYSQTSKDYWTGISKMADLASKFLLLYIRNELSIYIEISGGNELSIYIEISGGNTPAFGGHVANFM